LSKELFHQPYLLLNVDVIEIEGLEFLKHFLGINTHKGFQFNYYKQKRLQLIEHCIADKLVQFTTSLA